MKKGNKVLNVLTHIIPPFLGRIGILFPLLVFLFTKDKNTKEHSKKSLNWQLSLFLYQIAILGLFVIFVLTIATEKILTGSMPMESSGTFAILLTSGVFLSIITLIILNWIFCIIAAVKAGKNKIWNYPLTVPFIR